MNDDSERMNAVIQLLQNQRNNAQNDAVNLGAQLVMAQKQIAELEKLMNAKPEEHANGTGRVSEQRVSE